MDCCHYYGVRLRDHQVREIFTFIFCDAVAHTTEINRGKPLTHTPPHRLPQCPRVLSVKYNVSTAMFGPQ